MDLLGLLCIQVRCQMMAFDDTWGESGRLLTLASWQLIPTRRSTQKKQSAPIKASSRSKRHRSSALIPTRAGSKQVPASSHSSSCYAAPHNMIISCFQQRSYQVIKSAHRRCSAWRKFQSPGVLRVYIRSDGQSPNQVIAGRSHP